MNKSVSNTFAPTAQWDDTVLPYFTAAFGSAGLEALSAALCRPPLISSFRVNTNRITSEDAVRELSASNSSSPESSKNSWSLHPQVPDIVVQHGSGPHNVTYEDTEGKEVVISRRAAEAVLRGSHVFVPGVMACSQELQKGDLVAVSIAMEGAGTEGYITRGSCIRFDLPAIPSLYIGKGTAGFSRQDMFKQLKGVGVHMTHRVFCLEPCHGLLRGLGMLQNLPSAVVAHVLNPAPGSTVLDMCASPGGKTTHLAQLMRDQGCVIALDRSHAKAQHIRNLAAELGLTSIKAYKMDATTALQLLRLCTENREKWFSLPQIVLQASPSEAAAAKQQAAGDKARVRQERKAKVETQGSVLQARAIHGQAPLQQTDAASQPVCQGFPPESFQYILLDAPCSALGLRPRLAHHTTLSELRQTAVYQRKLLHIAVQLLKPGGVLVYSTCTINPGENEANINFVLQKFKNMQLVPQTPHLAGPGLTGVYMHEDGNQEEWLSPGSALPGLVQRFDPCGMSDTIGFFIAKFRKSC